MNDATQHTDGQDLISGSEAARILKVNRATVYRWGKAGKIPIAVQLSRGQLFDRREIEKIAEQGQMRMTYGHMRAS